MSLRRFFRLKRGCAKCIRWWERISLASIAVAALAELALWWHQGFPNIFKRRTDA